MFLRYVWPFSILSMRRLKAFLGDRSSPPGVFLEKGVPKICCKFTGEHPFLEHHFLKHLWRAASAELNLLVWAYSNNYVTQNLYINIHFPLIHTHTLRKKYLVTFTKDRKIVKFQNYVLVPILYKVC